ncbi:MAG: hypothetical protein U0R17_04530 [Acidimicrobiia bacterium]
MSVYTDERAAKIATNSFNPPAEPVDRFIAKLDALGVDTERVKGAQLIVLQDRQEHVIDVLQGLNEVPASDSRLGYILDTFGPKGHNLLSAGGISLVRAAGIALDRHEAFDLSAEDMIDLVDQYKVVQEQLYAAFRAFESIADIVEARKLEGGGVVKPFDLSDPRDFQLAQTLESYVKEWIATGVGDPIKVGAGVTSQEKDQVVITISDPATIEKLEKVGLKNSPGEGIFVEKNENGEVVVTLREPQIETEIIQGDVTQKRVRFTDSDTFSKIDRLNLLSDRPGATLKTTQYSQSVINLSNPDATLRAVSEFSDVMRDAQDQKHPERKGKVTGETLSFSVTQDIYKIGVIKGVTADGGRYIMQEPATSEIIPGSDSTFGPMER